MCSLAPPFLLNSHEAHYHMLTTSTCKPEEPRAFTVSILAYACFSFGTEYHCFLKALSQGFHSLGERLAWRLLGFSQHPDKFI